MSNPMTSARTDRPARRTREATVVRTERRTPALVRVVLTGPDLVGLPIGEHTDHYVKLVFSEGGADERPLQRAYTVRAYDAPRAELTLDVVVHGDQGVAGPWAAAARPGDRVRLLGPGGDHAPSAEVRTHLYVGDESALPAIAVALERLPAGHRAVVVAEVEDPAEEAALPSAAEVDVRWVHRATSPSRARRRAAGPRRRAHHAAAAARDWRPSCTVRPASCATYVATCGPRAWGSTGSPPRATGGADAPTRPGARRRRSGSAPSRTTTPPSWPDPTCRRGRRDGGRRVGVVSASRRGRRGC